MEDNCFTILQWFLPYINMNQPQVYVCPLSWKPLPSPSPPHPSGLSQITGFGCPASCIKLALAIYFTYRYKYVKMVIYMFQCSSSKSSHPRLLPLSPKVYSLHLCLLCCSACWIIITIFLNSLYIRQCTVFAYYTKWSKSERERQIQEGYGCSQRGWVGSSLGSRQDQKIEEDDRKANML